MAIFDKPSIIIEFNGLPGTGKTTVAGNLKMRLIERGILCHTSFQSKKTLKNFLSDVLEYMKIKCILKNYINSFAFNHNRHSRDKMIGQFFRSYKAFLKTKGMILIKDQGFVQALLSIAHLDTITNIHHIEVFGDYLRTHKIYFLRVDCISDKDISYERIQNRESNKARLDNMPSSELEEALVIQSKNLSIIRAAFDNVLNDKKNILVIDTKNSVKKNTDIILQRIDSLLKSNT